MKSPRALVQPTADALERVVADAMEEMREEILHAVEECQLPDRSAEYRGGYIHARHDILAAIKRVTVTP